MTAVEWSFPDFGDRLIRPQQSWFEDFQMFLRMEQIYAEAVDGLPQQQVRPRLRLENA